jgi:hypothetical protein
VRGASRDGERLASSEDLTMAVDLESDPSSEHLEVLVLKGMDVR